MYLAGLSNRSAAYNWASTQKNSLNPANRLNPQKSSEAFAADIVRRAGLQDPNQTNLNPSENLPESSLNPKLQKLENSLSGTVKHMAEKYGNAAGTAMMGIIYKNLGSGAVTEESLGDALLEVVRFVDKNFGTKEGDQLISHLNGNLNESLNEVFGNGKDEVFLASNGNADLPGRPEILSSSFKGVEQEEIELDIDVLDLMLKNLESKRKEAERNKNLPKELMAYTGQESFAPGLLTEIKV